MRRFASGDPLRAVAALTVVLFHAALLTFMQKPAQASAQPFGAAQPFLVSLQGGIYVFFVLSGYLLARPFVPSVLDDAERPDLRRYARNRLLRIVPAFWVVFSISLLLHGGGPGGVKSIAAVYGFAQNLRRDGTTNLIVQGWTLDVEMAFYLLLPLAALALARLLRRLDRRTRMSFVLVLLVTVYVASVAVKGSARINSGLDLSLLAMLFAFVPGIALAVVEPHLPRLRLWAGGTRRASWTMLGVAALLLFAYVQIDDSRHLWRSVTVSLGCAALVGAALVREAETTRAWVVFDNAPMRWLGKRSYGVYLVHMEVGRQALRLVSDAAPWTEFAFLATTMTSGSIVVAALLWRCVEEPALDRRLPWRPQQRVLRPAERTA